jgi:hypothetical protein
MLVNSPYAHALFILAPWGISRSNLCQKSRNFSQPSYSQQNRMGGENQPIFAKCQSPIRQLVLSSLLTSYG